MSSLTSRRPRYPLFDPRVAANEAVRANRRDRRLLDRRSCSAAATDRWSGLRTIRSPSTCRFALQAPSARTSGHRRIWPRRAESADGRRRHQRPGRRCSPLPCRSRRRRCIGVLTGYLRGWTDRITHGVQRCAAGLSGHPAGAGGDDGGRRQRYGIVIALGLAYAPRWRAWCAARCCRCARRSMSKPRA